MFGTIPSLIPTFEEGVNDTVELEPLKSLATTISDNETAESLLV